MDVKEALRARRSIRFFSDRQVPEDVIREIVQDAQRAPSWANAQPWKMYVETGEAAARTRRQHYQNVQRGLQGKSDLETGHRSDWGTMAYRNMRAWSGDLQSHLGHEDGIQFSESQARLFDAPALVYLTMHKGSPLWSIYDMGAFGQTLMLSAKDHGVDSMPAYEIVKYPQEIRRALSIPQDEDIVMGIGLGYADDRRINSFRSSRVPVDDILTVRS